MRTIFLKGHERALTKIVISKESDLIFTASKDNSPMVWRLETGERLGTFEGHRGVVWSICVNHETTRLLSGSGDFTVKLWNIFTGECVCSLDLETYVRVVDFASDSKSFLCVTDNKNEQVFRVKIFDISNDETHPVLKKTITFEKNERIYDAKFFDNNTKIILCIGNRIVIKDSVTGVTITEIKEHKKDVVQVQFDLFQTFFVSASNDGTARLFDAQTFKQLKVYSTAVPINTASISPIRDHILTGGGQPAQTVTTTSVDNDQFKAIFFDLVEESELARVAGHFGPVHTSAFFPDGTGFATGGEDGFCRIYKFDEAYYSKTLGV